MSNPGFQNNPLYTDITRLDHLSPQPTFSYFWNTESGRWEPATSLSLDLGSGVFSGSFNAEFDFSETNKLLSGISGQLSDVNDTETHRLLSGVSGELENLSESLQNLSISGGSTQVNRADIQPWKLITKTVNQKIEEDFILMEDIPDSVRYGTYIGDCYGQDKSIMDDILGNYHLNARLDSSTPETGHPDYFLHAEYLDTGR